MAGEGTREKRHGISQWGSEQTDEYYVLRERGLKGIQGEYLARENEVSSKNKEVQENGKCVSLCRGNASRI